MQTCRPKNFFPKFSDVSDHICAIYGHFSVPQDPILPFLRFSGKSHHAKGATLPPWSRPTPGGRSPAVWQPNQGQGSEKQPPTLPQATRGSVGGTCQASERLFLANSDRKKGVGALYPAPPTRQCGTSVMHENLCKNMCLTIHEE